MSASVVEQFVQRARGLYSLPAVAMRVLELTGAPKVDIRALKECIENDPALTMRILRVVNSSLFGLTREVTDLNQALALLGIKPLKMLVLGFSLPKNLFAALEADVLSRYWRHTLTKAVVARELAKRYWRHSDDEAFIAGLLQEIGELVLIQDLGEPYVRFVHRVHSTGGDLLSLEFETLGFDHAILSARLLNHWGLPEPIVQAIAMPHDADRILALPPHEQTLPQVLHLAEQIARLLTSEHPPSIDSLLELCSVYRKLTIADLPLLFDELDKTVQQLADVLNLQLAGGSDYRAVLADAHAQLANVASEAALEMLQPASSWTETNDLMDALSHAGAPKEPRSHAPSASSKPRAAEPAAQRERTIVATAEAAWSDPGLLGKTGAAASHCRAERLPLSLFLAEIDRFDQWIFSHGQETAATMARKLEGVIGQQLDAGSSCLHLGDGQYAVLLPDSERTASVATAKEIARRVREFGAPLGEATGTSLTLSIGLASLAVVPKNFPPQELIASARRCLDGAQLSGGDTLKSIELV